MSLGVFHIIKEGLILPSKNKKLILQVLLIYAITSILLITINQFSTVFLLKGIPKHYTEMFETDLMTYYKLYQTTINQAREFAIIKYILILLSFLIGTILLIIVILAFALTYTNNHITLKELLHKVKGNLKGPIITQILAGFFNSCYIILLAIAIPLLLSIGNGNGNGNDNDNDNDNVSVLMVAITGIVSVVAIIGWFYLATWLLLGVIVSVNEEGCYAFKAFKRASHLTKGRRCKGVWIYLVYSIISAVIYGGFGFGLASANKNVWIQTVAGWAGMVLVQVIFFFFLAAMTVYYCECKKAVDHEHFGANDGVYSRLATGDNV